MHRRLQKFLAGLLVLLASGLGHAAESINWYDWQPEAFNTAQARNQLIMVNVGHEGCTACRFMDRNTFSDPKVIDTLNAHFVAIQVDSEARPDIGERYSDWAWPATAFMRPDGVQILALRGSMRPQKFLPIIEDLIKQHATGTLNSDRREPYVAPTTPVAGPLVDLRDQVRRQLDRGFDDDNGGWGSAKVLEYAEPTLQLLLRGHLDNNQTARERGLKTAYGFANQTDRIWGGMFYASFRTFGNTVKEKRTESQAAALQIFASAYKISRDDEFVRQIALIDRYLTGHMQDPSGLFYASQKDLVPGLSEIDIEQYYALDDSGRRAHGLPASDHAMYTDLNARVIEGYVRAWQATDIDTYLETARRAANALISDRMTDAGWMRQLHLAEKLTADRRVHVLREHKRPFLRTQAYTGRALLALYQATADPSWLEHAKTIALAMRSELEDQNLGGFFGASADGTETIIARRKPLEDNGVAAQFFYLLAVATKLEEYKDVAESAIRAAASPQAVRREGRITGNLAMALELLNAGYVEFSVVGETGDKAAKALMAASHAVYEPRKIVHFEAPGRYPKRDRAALYICNDDACSLPIYDADDVAGEAAKFTPAIFAAASFDAQQIAR